ncbi:sodium-independent sulfate anion transporter isoform X2 [Pithys albifrons albifrons]|uniref:sodium-independent sulfate anion transporter isoform X2 n=1 Tax=Pithys albifrons albifrons TaxID=3385563 RepID=UPI003A5CC4F4
MAPTAAPAAAAAAAGAAKGAAPAPASALAGLGRSSGRPGSSSARSHEAGPAAQIRPGRSRSPCGRSGQGRHRRSVPPRPRGGAAPVPLSPVRSSGRAMPRSRCPFPALPVLRWLPRYRRAWLPPDMLAGLAVALTAVPQALAYAELAGLPLQYGLYSSFMGCFVYFFLGTAKDVTLGPTAIMSLLVSSYAFHEPVYAVLLAFLSGCIQLAMGLLQLGFLLDFISCPVIKGFTSAASITISFNQIKNILGLQGIPRQFFLQVYETLRRIGETRAGDAVLGLTCLAALTALRAMKSHLPRAAPVEPLATRISYLIVWISATARNALVVLFAGLVAYSFQVMGSQPLTLTGSIPRGLPAFRPPCFSVATPNGTVPFQGMVQDMGVGLAVVPLMGLLESIAIAKAFASQNGYRIDPNQELLALGVANILGSFVSSYPITGSFGRWVAAGGANPSPEDSHWGCVVRGLCNILGGRLCRPQWVSGFISQSQQPTLVARLCVCPMATFSAIPVLCSPAVGWESLVFLPCVSSWWVSVFLDGVCGHSLAPTQPGNVALHFRTAVNAQSGVCTPVGGLLTGTLVLLSLAYLTSLFYYIPRAALAAVIISAVVPMFDAGIFRTLWRVKRLDLVPLCVTFLLCFWEVQYGIVAGVLVSGILLLYSIARPPIKVLEGNVLLMQPGSSLHFPAIEWLRDTVCSRALTASPPRSVILDCCHISSIDYTVVVGLAELLQELHKHGLSLAFCGLKDPVLQVLLSADLEGFQHFPSREEAERCGGAEPWGSRAEPFTSTTESSGLIQ